MNMLTRILLVFALALASSPALSADNRVWLELALIEKSAAQDGVPNLRSALLDVQSAPTPSSKVVAVCRQKTSKDWDCDFKDMRTGDIDVWRNASGVIQVSGEITIAPITGKSVTVPFSQSLSFGKEVEVELSGGGVTFVLGINLLRPTADE